MSVTGEHLFHPPKSTLKTEPEKPLPLFGSLLSQTRPYTAEGLDTNICEFFEKFPDFTERRVHTWSQQIPHAICRKGHPEDLEHLKSHELYQALLRRSDVCDIGIQTFHNSALAVLTIFFDEKSRHHNLN